MVLLVTLPTSAITARRIAGGNVGHIATTARMSGSAAVSSVVLLVLLLGVVSPVSEVLATAPLAEARVRLEG